MKILLLLSLIFIAACNPPLLVITSPEDGSTIRNEEGVVNIEGKIEFSPVPSRQDLGEVECNGRFASVQREGLAWEIEKLKLTVQGINTIDCIYRLNRRIVDRKSTTVIWNSESAAPFAAVTASPLSGQAPLLVTFDASLSYDPDGGNIQEYIFDFGDGEVENINQPVVGHNYTSAGPYTVSVKVKDDEGEFSEPVEVLIQVYTSNSLPVAVIDADVTSGIPPLTVAFSGSRSTDDDGEIQSYTWTFPGGEVKTGVEVTHVFEQAGAHKVILEIRDDRNAPGQAEIVINAGSDNTPPVIGLIPGAGSVIRIPNPTFEISHFDEESGINLATIKAYLNGVDVTARLQVGAESTILPFTLEHPLSHGAHQIRIEVSDNSGNTSYLVYDYSVELGLITTSYIIGEVVDVNKNPIEGVTVSDIYAPPFKKINIKTDAQGKFKIPYDMVGTYRLSFNKSGVTESVRTVVQAVVEDTHIGTITLAGADPVITPISATSGGIAVNSTETLKFNIAPGVLPYDIDFQSTEFTNVDTLPGPLPAMSAFTFAFDLRPLDVNLLGEGGVLNMKDTLGFPVGAEIVYGIFDRELGRWLDSGHTLIVQAGKDGHNLPVPVDRLRAGDPNVPVMCTTDCVPPDQTEPNNDRDDEPCPTCSDSGSSISSSGGGNASVVNVVRGDLSVDHTIPSLTTSNGQYSLKFAYHSRHAEPRFFIRTDVSDLWAEYDSIMTEIKLQSMFQINDSAGKSGGGVSSFDIPVINPDDKYYETGSYYFMSKVQVSYTDVEYASASYFGGPPQDSFGLNARGALFLSNQRNDRTVIINRRNSAFGVGWGLEGQERLHFDEGGFVTWENGNDRFSYFIPNGKMANEALTLTNKKLESVPEITSVHAFAGSIYATDCRNNLVYRVSPSGKMDIVAGNGKKGFKGDGGLATKASLSCPVYVAPAETGGFYIADKENNRIRRVSHDGTIKTIAHHDSSPTSVSEDKMRAVYFTTESEVMLITPRGELETYSSENKGYVPTSLKNPSQVSFNHDDYPVVLDQENGRIITMYPQGRKYFNLLDSNNAKDLKGKTLSFKPKQLSYDPVTKINYILDQSGKLFQWKGSGSKDLIELTFNDHSLIPKQFSKSSTQITSMAFSPETGLVLLTDEGIIPSSRFTQGKVLKQDMVYSNVRGSFNRLTQKADGTFELLTPESIRKTFDDLGRIISIIGVDAKETRYVYGTQPFSPSSIQLPGGAYFNLKYDNRGYLQSVLDSANRETQFVVSDEGKLIKIINPDDSIKEYAYDGFLLSDEKDEDSKEVSYFYRANRLVKQIRPGGRERAFYPDELKLMDLNENGPVSGDMVSSEVDTYGGDCTVSVNLDSIGKVNKYTDCYGSSTEFDTNYQGKIFSTRSPEGRMEMFQHDFFGRETSVENKRGFTNTMYDPLWGRKSAVMFSNGSQIDIYYNDKGLVEEVLDQVGSSTLIGYDQNGNMLALRDARQKITSFEYDEHANLIAIIDPLNNKTEYTRDSVGNISKIIDPQNRATNFGYDAFNRIINILDPLNHATSLAYTPGGKIKAVTDARGYTTNFEYDPVFHKVSRVTNELNQSEEYLYDGNERLMQKTNKDGSAINYHYNLNDWPTEISTGNWYTRFAYDMDGLPVEISNPNVTLERVYDHYGRIIQESNSLVNGELNIAYNNVGLKSSLSYHANNTQLFTIKYFYDPRQLLSRIEAIVGGNVIHVDRYFDELGRPEMDIYSNGMKTIRRFDDAGRLTYLSNETQSGAPLSKFEYSHNPAGTISQIIKTFARPELSGSIGRNVIDYGYDNNDRLTFATGDGTFSYDPLGNQLQRNGDYNEINQLLEDGEFSYDYSTNGNLSLKTSKITGERIEYVWDIENRLVQTVVKRPDGAIKRSVEYMYDGLNRRVQKLVNSSPTTYAYEGEDILVEFGENNAPQAFFIHGSGIDEPMAMVRDVDGNGRFDQNEIFFYGKDHLNSIHSLVDHESKVVQRYDYSSYGKTKIEKTSPNAKIIASPYGFTSREHDQETGDYFYRARYYDPGTGRFLTLDFLGFAAGDSNFYRYVLNNPIIYNDPFGTNPALGAAIGTAVMPGLGTVVGAAVGGVAAYYIGSALGDAYSKNSNKPSSQQDNTPLGQNPRMRGPTPSEIALGLLLAGKAINSCSKED